VPADWKVIVLADLEHCNPPPVDFRNIRIRELP